MKVSIVFITIMLSLLAVFIHLEHKVLLTEISSPATIALDPNFIEIIKEKDRQIQLLRQIDITLENRNTELAEKLKAEQK